MESETKDSDEHFRYIVKFKDDTIDPPTTRRMVSRALKGQLIKMLPDDNAEILHLTTQTEIEEWENRDDVEYIEKGESKVSRLNSYFRSWG